MYNALKWIERSLWLPYRQSCFYAPSLGADHAALLSILVAGCALLPFFLRYEMAKPRPRDMMPVAVLAAVAAMGRIVFAPFPNFTPVSAIVIVAAVCFGRQSGFLTGVLAALLRPICFRTGSMDALADVCVGNSRLLRACCSEKDFSKKFHGLHIRCSVGFLFGFTGIRGTS